MSSIGDYGISMLCNYKVRSAMLHVRFYDIMRLQQQQQQKKFNEGRKQKQKFKKKNNVNAVQF